MDDRLQKVIDGLTILKGCGAKTVSIINDELTIDVTIRYDDIVKRLVGLGWTASLDNRWSYKLNDNDNE